MGTSKDLQHNNQKKSDKTMNYYGRQITTL
jgi:hypothetical protein